MVLSNKFKVLNCVAKILNIWSVVRVMIDTLFVDIYDPLSIWSVERYGEIWSVQGNDFLMFLECVAVLVRHDIFNRKCDVGLFIYLLRLKICRV
jgi:hypothetical protein